MACNSIWVRELPIPPLIKKLITEGSLEDVEIGLNLFSTQHPKIFNNFTKGDFLFHDNERLYPYMFSTIIIEDKPLVIGGVAFWHAF